MTKDEFFKENYFCTSEKFNWKEDSWKLCYFHSKYFKLWWDPIKFDYEYASDDLCHYCSVYFYIWYDQDKFNWYFIETLKSHFTKYKHIWEPDYILRKII